MGTWDQMVSLTPFWLLVFANAVSVKNRRFSPNIAPVTPRRISQISFINANLPQKLEPRSHRIGSGWGFSDKYSWKEDGEHVYITAALGNVQSSDISVDITKDSLHVAKRGSNLPILSGKTKGRINVGETLWTIESLNGKGRNNEKDVNSEKNLQITLKKADSSSKEWFGVLLGENVRYKQYDPTVERTIHSNCIEPNDVFWGKSFSDVKPERLNEFFLQWITRKGDQMVPFGKPITEVEFEFVPSDLGGKITFSDTNTDEYINVIIKPKEGNSSEILFVNSPSTDILAGKFGNELRRKLLRSLNTLVQKFEMDMQEIFTLMNTTKKDEFSYAGSNAFLSLDNMDEYNRYHEMIQAQLDGSTGDKLANSTSDKSSGDKSESSTGVFKDDETGLSIDWNASSGTNSTQEDLETKKKMINELTEAIKNTKGQQPMDTMKAIIKRFKERLVLSPKEYEELWQSAMSRVDKDVEESKKQQDVIRKVKPEDDWFTDQLNANIPMSITTGDSFDEIMNNPFNIDSCLLVKKYHSITKTQKEQLRKRWKNNEIRLKTLIMELFEAPENLISTICNNYRQLLISEDYPTLMKSYLLKNQVKNEMERNRLKFLNEFVLSLYKDAELFTLQDEQFQLAKIKQICDWAFNDYEKLNDFVEAHKHLYDVNFMTYLRLAISKETERLREDGVLNEQVPDPQKNPWLCILVMIERGITSLIEADMAEDIYTIGFIVYQKRSDVRSWLTEFILATTPRSDWKAFKRLVVSITDSLLNKPMEERDAEEMPEWVPEACHQLRDELEKMIPDWLIYDMLSEDDRTFMIHNNKKKSPLLQDDFKWLAPKEPPSPELPSVQVPKVKTH